MSITVRLPNRTGQAGLYRTGTPNYVDVDNTLSALPGMVTFAVKALDDSWITNDLMSILIKKDEFNYKVWLAQWDGINEWLSVVTEEETVGTLSNFDTVNVIAVLTTQSFDKLVFEVQSTEVTGTTYTIVASDKGKQICCTNSSPVIITLDAALPVGFHCLIIQENTGVVSIARAGSDTINGNTVNVALGGQYSSAYVYKRTAGTWIALT